jgi:hypothetical protein
MKIVFKDNMAATVGKMKALIKSQAQTTLNASRLLFQPREAGKGLSSNDFTDADKAKLDKMDIIFIDIPEDFPDSPTPEQFVNSFGMTLRELYDKTNAGSSVLVRCYVTITGSSAQVLFPVNFMWDATDEYVACYMSGWVNGCLIMMFLAQLGSEYSYLKQESEDVLTQSSILQTTGFAAGAVMSQKAVTDAFRNLVLVVNGLIPTGTAITQSALDALGLRSQVISNIMDGNYYKIEMRVDSQNRVMYNYSAMLQGGQKKIFLEKMQSGEGYSIVANSNGTYNIQFIR